jgi:hypothetical protein
MTERAMKQVQVTPAQIYALVGRSPQEVRNLIISALHESGIDVSNLKAIEFKRLPNDGCLFVGPARC